MGSSDGTASDSASDAIALIDLASCLASDGEWGALRNLARHVRPLYRLTRRGYRVNAVSPTPPRTPAGAPGPRG